MRIVHVARTLDPAAGGPPQVCLRLGAAQGALGHEVHVVYYSTGADRARTEADIQRVPNHGNVRFHPLADQNLREVLLVRRARRVLEDLVPSADFVHIHGVWGAILKAAAGMARQRGVAHCFQAHGMLDPWSLSQKRLKKRLGLLLGYRAALGGASFILALNSDEARLIAPLQLGNRTMVLPNGIFVDEIEPLPAPGTFRAAHPRIGDRPVILFLSRLHYKKGLDILAESFALLGRQRDDVCLVVAGPDEGARPDFERRVADAGMTDRVHLVGPLYGEDKLAALADATCFCLPSRQEGFSVAIVEAMACGLPVIISEPCHFPEVASAGAGLVVPLSVPAVAKALGAVIADPNQARSMGAAGAALVRERYRWEAIGRQSVAFYQEAQQTEKARRTG